MIDIAYENALHTVARGVLGDLAANCGELWETYPEIGERDWERITEIVPRLFPWPPPDDFAAAYDLLAERSEQ